MRHRYLLPLLAPFLLLLAVTTLHAAPGDTTRVRVFDGLLWKNHGGENRWGIFPDSAVRHERILMHFRLKCPSGGCGEWDYTMSVYVQRHTGRMDSTLENAPSVRIDGAIRDSVPISLDTTWTSRFDATNRRTDSTLNAPMLIVYYGDTSDAWRPTDTLVAWPAGYYRYSYDATGAKVDSSYVVPDSIVRVTTTPAYLPFEIVDPIEIGRFITPYGKWFREGREFDWVYDVTDYASLLHDSVEIRTFYDGWSQGSIYTLDFDLVEGTPSRDVFRVDNLYAGGFPYGDPNNSIENYLTPKTITVDPRSTNTTLKITTTGHGFGGTDNAAEFSDKTHTVTVDGTPRFVQRLWREDCGQNPVYPQAGTWYYQRGGWCPGDMVHPFFYDLTPFVTPGDTAVVDYDMQPYTNADLSHPATYFVHAQVLYATGPNFANDAAIASIHRPTTEFRFRRQNPVCADAAPIVELRNAGGAPLTSATITYGVEGAPQHTYEWTGTLKFLESTEVELPAIDLGATPGRFVVAVSNPNGSPDEYPRDDAMSTSFDVPKRASGSVRVSVRTDDFFDDAETTNGISWQVLDRNDNVLYSRDGFADRTTYIDTLDLPDGCYRFIIKDDYFGDGLIPIRGTAGSYSLRDSKGAYIANGTSSGEYLASFGDREVTSFVVSGGAAAPSQEESMLDDLSIYPNPSDGTFSVALGGRRVGRLTLTVTSIDGAEIVRREIEPGDTNIALDLSAQPAGTYLARIDGSHGSRLEKLIVEPR
jgi:hypothetical protein